MRMRPLANNYAFLLSGLLLLFFVMPLIRSIPGIDLEPRTRWLCSQLGFTAMMMTGVWSLCRERKIFRVGLSLMWLSVALAFIEFSLPGKTVEFLAFATTFFFCIISVFVTGRHVFSAVIVDRNMLFGAVCVYLLIGFIWAVLYGLIGELSQASFQGIEILGNGQIPFDNFMYFSLVTLASLGYGDITPVTPLTRALACVEVIVGQFYLAIMVAGLVALHLKDRNDR